MTTENMTFEQFQASGKECNDIGAALQADTLEGVKGRLYVDALYIESWDASAPNPPPSAAKWWLLMIGRDEEASTDLAALEKKLFKYAISEGYVNPIDDARLVASVEDAQFAFWAVIAAQYPEVKSGDFAPDATFEIEAAMKLAVERWLSSNHPAFNIGE